MVRILESIHGNPSSPHRIAHDAAEVLEDARMLVGSALGVEPTSIHFTAGATEAANQVLRGAVRLPGSCRRILTSPTEHASVLATLEDLERSEGVQVVRLPVDSRGVLDLRVLEDALSEPADLVCCMLANNETGVVQDVGAVVEVAHRRGARVFCDVVQALGKMPVDLAAMDVDFANISAHKIHGPKGIGALYVKSGCALPALHTGGHQEEGRRAGTEAVHDIAGLAQALRDLPRQLGNCEGVRAVRKEFEEGLFRILPEVEFASGRGTGLCNTVHARFPGIPNSVLLGWLDHQGIAVSAGSACNTSSDRPSHVLTAMGRKETAARESLRFSLDPALSPRLLRRQARIVLGKIDDYLRGKVPDVQLLTPATLSPLLQDPRVLVVDARHSVDRKWIPPLSRAVQISWPFGSHLEELPKDRFVVFVCQVGFDAPILAWKLRKSRKGPVGFLAGGMMAWKCSPNNRSNPN